MRLCFPESELRPLAKLYRCDETETALLAERKAIRTQGFLTREQLERVAKWKSPRRADATRKNSDEFIRETTTFALGANDERARIEPLTLLDGVMWPTASAILHLYHREKYPILDFRALESVSSAVPTNYDFPFWWSYVQFTRKIAERNRVDMRTLDRALWQYSKQNLRPRAK